MTYDIPAFFEDIEPFHELALNSLTPLLPEEIKNYAIINETHKVADPGTFSFLQYPLNFFGLGIDKFQKVKSALLLINDGDMGQKMLNDLIKYNSDPHLVFTLDGNAKPTNNHEMEEIYLKTYTWRMGVSSMSFSLFSRQNQEEAPLYLSRISLQVIE